MGQKGEPGAPWSGPSGGIIYGNPSMNAPRLNLNRPGEGINHDFTLLLVA
jgi:hypothetical protein